MTKPGHTYRVDPDRVIVSTNIRSRGNGLPRSNAHEPEDPAVAVHIGAICGIERWGVSEMLPRKLINISDVPAAGLGRE